jgi:hypothetical protein
MTAETIPMNVILELSLGDVAVLCSALDYEVRCMHSCCARTQDKGMKRYYTEQAVCAEDLRQRLVLMMQS